MGKGQRIKDKEGKEKNEKVEERVKEQREGERVR